MDAAEKESARPDFAGLVYPGHLAKSDKTGHLETGEQGLNPNVPVTAETPPTLLVQAEDDHVDGAEQSVVYFAALENAGVPAEMHIYAQGGMRSGCGRRSFRSAIGRIWSRPGCAQWGSSRRSALYRLTCANSRRWARRNPRAHSSVTQLTVSFQENSNG